MIVYYASDIEEAPDRHRIILAVWDYQQPKTDRADMKNGHAVAILPETPPAANQRLMLDVYNWQHETDSNNKGRFYVDGLGQIQERRGWRPRKKPGLKPSDLERKRA